MTVLAGLALALVTACSSPAPSTSAGASAGPALPSTPSSLPAATTSTVVTITSEDVPEPAPQDPVLPADAPRRIVSLATGVAETLAALGLSDRVVGRDESSTSARLSEVPVLTRAHAVSAERVLATEPDLVLVDAATSPIEALDQIRSTGVPVVEVPQAWTLDDIAPRTRAVARAAGVSNADADAVIAGAGGAPTSAGDSESANGSRPRVAFLYLRGTAAVLLLGGDGSGADALISAAGGVDVGEEAGLGAFVPLTAEALAAADPDVLLVMTKGLESVGGVEGLVALPGVAQTRAGREQRIVVVDDTLLLSFGPRTGALVSALSDAWDRVPPR
jgi:iron complex transport system substrate-binding protein